VSYHLSRPIVIAAYDPRWPELYQEELRRLREALHGFARQVEHIGSTSVPGLAAKPIIDISVGADGRDGVEAYLPALRALGYEDCRINPVFERRMFSKGGPFNEGTHHLHVTDAGSSVWAGPILLRDYLRAHPEEAAWYEQVKREAAATAGNDLNHYDHLKGPCVEALMVRAGAWEAAGRKAPERGPGRGTRGGLPRGEGHSDA
jgi:GrpB-like predicted nucleotidyltransferase (UPF0157 family)